MRRVTVPLAVLVAAAVAAGGGEAAEPTARLQIGAWLPYWSHEAGAQTIKRNRDIAGSASPFWFEARGARDIAAYPGAGDTGVLDALERARVRVIPTVTSSMRPQTAIAVLGDARRRGLHVRELAKLARPYDGIDFNYEWPAVTTRKREAERVRAALTAFFGQACARLHRDDRLCVVTVMPRTGDEREIWHGELTPWVYDYEAIGAVADRVRVMAYDQHTTRTGPGAIAGARWVRRVARYTARRVPPRRVELGIPLYGRIWTGYSSAGGRQNPTIHTPGHGGARIARSAVNATWAEAEAERRRLGARKRWSARQLSPYFRAAGREAWYSDARSVAARARIAKEHGFRGVCLWAPAEEDPRAWRRLRRVRGG